MQARAYQKVHHVEALSYSKPNLIYMGGIICSNEALISDERLTFPPLLSIHAYQVSMRRICKINLTDQNSPFWLKGMEARPICFFLSWACFVGDVASKLALGFDQAWSSLNVL